MGERYDEVGHMSPLASDVEASARTRFAAELDLFNRANRLAMRILMREFPQQGPDPFIPENAFLAATYLGIAIRRCEAAAILSLRGLTFEADTMTRAALEQTFVLASFLKDPLECLIDLDADDVFQKRKLLRNYVARHTAQPLSESNAARLAERVKEMELMPQGVQFLMKEHARRGGLLHLYDELYWFLSTTAAHPTNTLTNLHMTWTADVRRIEFGPDDEVGKPLIRTTNVLLIASRYIANAMELQDSLDEGNSLDRELRELAERARL